MLCIRPAAIALLVAAMLWLPTARSADLVDHAHSLKYVPRDAAVYSASLRLREQIEMVADSNWWQRVQQVPILQLGLMQAEQAWFAPPTRELEQVKEWIESEEGQEIVATLGEMVSDEVFLYADGDVTALFELLMDLNSQVNSAQFDFDGFGEVEDERMEDIIRGFLEENKDDLRVPDMVMGFRIEDDERATRHLDRLEGLLKQAMAECPVPLNEHFTRETSGSHDMLVLNLPSTMIPWEEVEEEIDDPEFYDLIREVMDDKSVTAVIGRVEEFIVISIGDTAEHLAEFGSGDLLADHPAIEKMEQHADEELVSIEFVSGEFLEAVNNNERSIRDLAVMGQGFLEMANITEEDRERIASDMDELADDIITLLPKMGHLGSVTYLTERGYEGYAYNWAEQPAWDGTQRLSLLDYVGGNPAAFFASRGKSSPESYDKFTDWCSRIAKDIETIAVSEADPDDWAEYVEAKQMIMPFIKRIDAANRDHLVPGFADGQGALVLDLSVAEQSWCDPMSPAEKPLPMPALTMLMGVSDADAVEQGVTEYYNVVQDVLDMAHEVNPNDVPEIDLPEPTISESDGIKNFQFDIDASLGASPKLAPHFALGENVAALGYLPDATMGMLTGTSLNIDSPVADFDRPLFLVCHIDFNQMLDAAKPWIDYGFQVVKEQDLDEGNMSFFIKPQLDQILELTRALRSFTSVTYYEDGVWVTRSETHIEDLE